MKNFLLAIWVLLLSCLAFQRSFAQGTSPKSVLFVGNSYTYFWNLPQQVALLAEAGKIELKTRQSTVGGINLGTHWRGERGLESRALIASGQFDAVVIQDLSTRPVEDPDSTLYFGRLFGELIRENGARPYVYLTWARAYNPLMQEKLTQTYTQLAQEIGGTLVPVGPAWELARSLRPDLPLYDPDGSHPSALGTYLTACVFYGVFTGKSPVGLPNRLLTQDKDGEKLYLNISSPEDALFLQQIAEKAILKFDQ